MTASVGGPGMAAGALGLALSDVSLTVMLIGAITLAGATVAITAIPDWRPPRWFRRRSVAPQAGAQQLVTQRRVVTGRAPVLQPAPPPADAAPPPRHQRALTDGRRPTSIDERVAEAVIDRFLKSDPELLAKTISAWLATDDRPRRTTN